MKWLEIIAKDHKKHVRTIERFGEHFYAEDLVQEMYLRLHRNKTAQDIVIDGKVNEYFIYLTLRSIFLNFRKAKTLLVKNNDLPLLCPDVDNTAYFTAQNQFRDKIEKEIDTWHVYDQMLFRLYLNSGKSMREIANGTGISLRSIFNTINDCKERIKANCSEDYEDLINEDYEKL